MIESDLSGYSFCIGFWFSFGASFCVILIFFVFSLAENLVQLVKLVLEWLNLCPKKNPKTGKRKCDGCAFFGLWKNEDGNKVIGCRIIKKNIDPVIYRNSPYFVFADCPVNARGVTKEGDVKNEQKSNS